MQIYRVIKYDSSDFSTSVKVVHDKSGNLTLIKITFTHLGALKFHLKQLTNEKVDPDCCFCKTWKNGVRVVCSKK